MTGRTLALLLVGCVFLTAGPAVQPGSPQPGASTGSTHRAPPTPRIPVVLDTDIGDDIDDTWALGLLLQCPELDLKLVLTDYGRPLYRARLAAKLLEAMGRADVPVAMGLEIPNVGGAESQAAWLGDYDLARYPGRVFTNGIEALIDLVMASHEPITILAIGPVPNLAAALQRQPDIARRARFIGMHGSVRRGYGGRPEPDAEWNVRCDPRALETVLAAPWEVTLTPLDTCGLVRLDGADFRRVRSSRHPVARTILENYRAWAARRPELAPKDVETQSSTLFDCVAVYLAVSEAFCEIEPLPLRVTADGHTRLQPDGRTVRAATQWKDLPAFRRWLADRIAGPSP